MKLLLFALLAALVLPPLASGGEPTLVSRDVPLSAGRTISAARAPDRFNLVGLHWQGAGTVQFRTRSASGRWSAWRAAAPEAEDRPDSGSRELARRSGWRIGNPHWTGTSNAIKYRLSGRVRRLRAYFVWSPEERVPLRTTSLASSPPILRRLNWSANERIQRAAPSYARSLRFALVHHTAGSNSYTPAQSAAIVRGIQLYHVQGNGWNDIGYNFLVDKYGQVFEGRKGGLTRNVIGAHAEGFNTGSVGVSLIGNYGSSAISPKAAASLVQLLSWRLDVAHVDPGSTLTWSSGGNPRFPTGAPVFLRTISAHRDTGFTSCPGDALYRKLNALGGSVSVAGLPKLYAPAAAGSVGQRIRFTARLSAAIPWTVTVRDSAGAVVARGSGSSSSVNWTWDARKAARKSYSYTIEAGAAVRPAAGKIGGGKTTAPPPPPTQPPALIGDVKVLPATVTPNGDGVQDTTSVSYTLGLPALVTATLVDATGATVATLFSERREAGARSFRLTADSFPDGTYKLVLNAASDDGKQLSAIATLVISRLLRALAAVPPVFSPNGDGRFDRVRLRFELLGPAMVKIRVLKAGASVTTLFSGELGTGAQGMSWDGAKSGGRLLDGRYQATVTVSDAAATVSQTVLFQSDTTAPRLRWLGGLRFSVDEPAAVTAVRGPARVTLKVERAGHFLLPRLAGRGSLQIRVEDAVGNIGRSLRIATP